MSDMREWHIQIEGVKAPRDMAGCFYQELKARLRDLGADVTEMSTETKETWLVAFENRPVEENGKGRGPIGRAEHSMVLKPGKGARPTG